MDLKSLLITCVYRQLNLMKKIAFKPSDVTAEVRVSVCPGRVQGLGRGYVMPSSYSHWKQAHSLSRFRRDLCTQHLQSVCFYTERLGINLDLWDVETKEWGAGSGSLFVECPQGPQGPGGEWVYYVNNHLSLFKSFNFIVRTHQRNMQIRACCNAFIWPRRFSKSSLLLRKSP